MLDPFLPTHLLTLFPRWHHRRDRDFLPALQDASDGAGERRYCRRVVSVLQVPRRARGGMARINPFS